MASFHWRSSPGMIAANRFGSVKVSPRSVEWALVTPGASMRLVKARLGTPEAGEVTAKSAPPPPPGAPPPLQPAAKKPPPPGRPPDFYGYAPPAAGRLSRVRPRPAACPPA